MVQQLTPPAPINTQVSIQPVTISINAQDVATPLLQNVAVGAILEGYVVNRDAQQNPILRTTLGDVLVKSDLFLKTGSEVVIRVDATVESRARILTIDGLSPQDYVARNVTAPTSDAILSSSLLPQSQAVSSASGAPAAQSAPIILPAVLLSSNVIIPDGMPPDVAQYWAQTMASLQKDVNIAVKILATELPLLDEAPAQQAALSPTSPAATTTLVNPAATTSSKAPSVPLEAPIITTQTPVSVPATATQGAAPTTTAQVATTNQSTTPNNIAPTAQNITAPTITNTGTTAIPTKPVAASTPEVMAAQPSSPKQFTNAVATSMPANQPAKASPTTAGTPSAPTMIAQVIGHEMDGASIVQSPVGTLKLFTAHPLPTGTKLTLEIAPNPDQRAPAPIAPLLPADLEELTGLARDWHSVRDAINAVAMQDPALATQLIQNILPKPHAKLTNEMLFLLSAIKSGSPEQWLGKRAIEILDMNSPEILKRLSREFGQLQQVFSDAIPQWMSVVMPFYSDAQIQQIRMFFKHEDESGKKASQGGGQRFLIEVDLSHLGELQLDGFVKKAESSKHFDLVVRSARHLSNDVEQQIRTIFDNALQTTGYIGYMHFQQGLQHFVRPMEAIKEALHGDKNTILA
ncbi:MAG: hypothetical protein ACOYJ2_08580 [Rickettsiales bacterium]